MLNVLVSKAGQPYSWFRQPSFLFFEVWLLGCYAKVDPSAAMVSTVRLVLHSWCFGHSWLHGTQPSVGISHLDSGLPNVSLRLPFENR